MKTIIAVIVHNRFYNIRDWITIWKAAQPREAELVIIHNYDGQDKIGLYCGQMGIRYIKRETGGFDIGAFQDVARERLAGFPNDWQYLLWCTDDTMPITLDFLTPFLHPLEQGRTELTCMQVSDEITRHVRTTGFCITKDFSQLLSFPCDPITTRRQCKDFEHSGQATLYQQCLTYHVNPEQTPANIQHSTLYDKGFWSRNAQAILQRHLYDRMAEFKTFIAPLRNSLLTIAVPCYEMRGVGAQMLKELLDSIRDQKTNYDYDIVISDSSNNDAVRRVFDRYLEWLPLSYHRNLTRIGASQNINNCLDLAKAELTKIMCQDDKFCHPGAIDRFVEGLESHGWVIANSLHMDGGGNVYSKQETIYKHGNFVKNITGMPSAVAWKKTDLRFDERLKTICDMFFYHQLYERYGEPGIIKEFVVAQRYHNNSLSRNQLNRKEDEVNFLKAKKLI